MSFVGTRPEVVKYVKKYKPEYLATLLLPAGITSEYIIYTIGVASQNLPAARHKKTAVIITVWQSRLSGGKSLNGL